MLIRENPAPRLPGPVKDRRVLPLRWSPAHHRVLQYFFPCLGRHREEGAGPPSRKPEHHPLRIGDRSRQYPGQGRRGRPGQCAQRAERRGHPYVRPVQQPRDRQRGERVHGRHRRSGVMPGVTVPGGGGHVPGVRRVLRHRHRGGAVHGGQREVQYPLCGQGEGDGRDRRVAAPGERPDRRELRHDQQGHQPPGHGAFGDRVVPEGREYGAEHGEQAGPRARTRVAGPARSGMSLVPGHVIRWHGRHHSLPAGRSGPQDCAGTCPPSGSSTHNTASTLAHSPRSTPDAGETASRGRRGRIEVRAFESPPAGSRQGRQSRRRHSTHRQVPHVRAGRGPVTAHDNGDRCSLW